MTWGPLLIRGLGLLVAATKAASGQHEAAPPVIPLELGGVAILPCAGVTPSLVEGCLLSPQPGLTFFIDGKGRNASAEPFNATHCSCSLPAADAESVVQVSFRGRNASKPLQRAGVVQYAALMTATLSRRPYLSTDTHAEVVVSMNPLDRTMQAAAVSVLLLPSRQPLLERQPVEAAVAKTIAFSLAEVPAVAEVQVAVVAHRPSGPPLERRLFLSRVLPPPPAVQSFVQIDYSRKTLLVNGRPLLGAGYYDSQSVGPANLSRQGAAGINWNMRYFTSNDPAAPLDRFSDAFIRSYLDWSHSAGIYVMFDLHAEFQVLAKKGNSTEAWRNITTQVLQFRDHPALLGWYICDDCMTQWLIAQRSAGTPTVDHWYRALKQLDPYHPAVGALESVNMNAFTTANEFVPAPSLDVVMFENYFPDLAQNAHRGIAIDPGMDGALASWPLTWEPVVNCPGVWLNWDRKDLTVAQRALMIYSMSWLSAIGADVPLQLHFRLFPFEALHPDNSTYYEEIMLQVGRYGEVARSVQDFLLAPPSGVVEPSLVADDAATPGPCKQCARLWRRAVEGAPSSFCAALAVVNTQNVSATRTFRLRGADRWPGATSAPLRRLDGPCLGATTAADESGRACPKFSDGVLSVTLAAFDTHVYVTPDCGGEFVV